MAVDEQSQPQLKESTTSQTAKTTPKQENQECIFHPNVPTNGDHHAPDHQYRPQNEANSEEEFADQEFFTNLPPGYRFNPTDVELIIFYLKPETENKKLPRNQIRHVNLYQYSPGEITARYKELTEREWYFFTPRDRKYRNGNRPNRAAGTGYWKATGADKSIIHNGDVIGFRKALVFYEGKPPRGEKTSWIMHEYRVKEGTPKKKSRSEIDMRLDDYILCRIYKKSDKLLKTDQIQGEVNEDQHIDHDVPNLKEQNRGSPRNDEFVNTYRELPHVMDAPVPMNNKRLRPISLAAPTNFATPLIYPGENLSGDQNIWSLPGMTVPELSEIDFGVAEFDNMLISMYHPGDDLELMLNPDINSSFPKKI